ncbi:F-box domain protein [Pseudohyphozyma bogoriensis]|nr:F-box domain protein [Pseudohyphozyma bogoriensis]
MVSLLRQLVDLTASAVEARRVTSLDHDLLLIKHSPPPTLSSPERLPPELLIQIFLEDARHLLALATLSPLRTLEASEATAGIVRGALLMDHLTLAPGSDFGGLATRYFECCMELIYLEMGSVRGGLPFEVLAKGHSLNTVYLLGFRLRASSLLTLTPARFDLPLLTHLSLHSIEIDRRILPSLFHPDTFPHLTSLTIINCSLSYWRISLPLPLLNRTLHVLPALPAAIVVALRHPILTALHLGRDSSDALISELVVDISSSCSLKLLSLGPGSFTTDGIPVLAACSSPLLHLHLPINNSRASEPINPDHAEDAFLNFSSAVLVIEEKRDCVGMGPDVPWEKWDLSWFVGEARAGAG